MSSYINPLSLVADDKNWKIKDFSFWQERTAPFLPHCYGQAENCKKYKKHSLSDTVQSQGKTVVFRKLNKQKEPYGSSSILTEGIQDLGTGTWYPQGAQSSC